MTTQEITGSQALAYGALEAGVQFVTGYPGSPATSVVDALLRVADERVRIGGTDSKTPVMILDTCQESFWSDEKPASGVEGLYHPTHWLSICLSMPPEAVQFQFSKTLFSCLPLVY